jgi:hypothetical protein
VIAFTEQFYRLLLDYSRDGMVLRQSGFALGRLRQQVLRSPLFEKGFFGTHENEKNFTMPFEAEILIMPAKLAPVREHGISSHV